MAEASLFVYAVLFLRLPPFGNNPTYLILCTGMLLVPDVPAGGMIFSCSDHVKVMDIQKITWTNPTGTSDPKEQVGSTVCLDDVKLV